MVYHICLLIPVTRANAMLEIL